MQEKRGVTPLKLCFNKAGFLQPVFINRTLSGRFLTLQSRFGNALSPYKMRLAVWLNARCRMQVCSSVDSGRSFFVNVRSVRLLSYSPLK
jgi:hypothetical protein